MNARCPLSRLVKHTCNGDQNFRIFSGKAAFPFPFPIQVAAHLAPVPRISSSSFVVAGSALSSVNLCPLKLTILQMPVNDYKHDSPDKDKSTHLPSAKSSATKNTPVSRFLSLVFDRNLPDRIPAKCLYIIIIFGSFLSIMRASPELGCGGS
jgi:hypothetical protein